MNDKKIKIKIDGKTVDAIIKDDYHFLGGKKVKYTLPNGVVAVTSINLVKLVEDEEVN
jgi:hypothetical protein